MDRYTLRTAHEIIRAESRQTGRDRRAETDGQRQTGRETVYLDVMDHLLMLMLLLWSSGERYESSKRSVWRIYSDCVHSGSTLRECSTSYSSSSILNLTCSDSRPVRLVNGTSLCSGRLEVKTNQSNQSNQWWSSVCEDDIDQQDAEVVCRELGCGAPSVLQGALYGEVEAPMWTKEFQCGGHESALLDCRSSGSDRNTCSPGKAVGLTCSEPVRLVGGDSRCAGTLEVKHQGDWRPVHGSDWTLKKAYVAYSRPVRLVNGTSLCSGRLEVKTNQSNQWWSSVCEDDFDQQDAEVVCRELGCGAPSVLQGALYGEVEAPMWTKEFQCGGHESALLDCRSSGSDRNTCSPGKAVGLTCSEPVRLVGGDSRCAGTLEVKHQGDWRPVDGSDWTLKKASVACRELDCGSAVSVGERKESSKRSVWWIYSGCVQSGSALRECSISYSSSSILNLACPGKPISDIIYDCAVMYLQASRRQTPGRRENIELDDFNLGVPADEEEGAQGAE
ncbi:scavenger receptor cysteine-rich type 1 protein M130-like [Anoplopoma fimbria]|uniref:scavenger receptor cysteine-rich type 1 protein M130-like n=1 Tax=Anoplopoma fimbria TaxID=229290 RepID=UPI0023EA804B|nr:scavenger receptor cysteine-rich type 1 protein M130-like [Anoplopoma fimbria]